MVTRIKSIATLTDALRYNEEKVARRQAEILDAPGFLGDKNRMTYDQKLRRLQDQNDLNTRARYKTLHATINFHPDENPSNTNLTAIARRYMDGLGLAKNPYLVYRHHDQGHTHLHIVASLIDNDGKRLDTHHLASRRSEPTRKIIEQEFHLRPNAASGPALAAFGPALAGPHRKIPDGPVQKVDPTRDEPLVDQVYQVTAHAVQRYTFGSLQEYNAVLRPYNLTTETGGPDSKTRRHQGLYYTTLDDHGKKIAPPIMSSDVPGRPTLYRLQKKFLEAPAARREHLPSLRQKINDVLHTDPIHLAELAQGLARQNIDIILPPAHSNHDHIYLDHDTHTAITGQDLGPGFSAQGLQTALADAHHGPSTKKPTPTSADDAFNPRVPQLLTALLEPTDDAATTKLHQGQRPKP